MLIKSLFPLILLFFTYTKQGAFEDMLNIIKEVLDLQERIIYEKNILLDNNMLRLALEDQKVCYTKNLLTSTSNNRPFEFKIKPDGIFYTVLFFEMGRINFLYENPLLVTTNIEVQNFINRKDGLFNWLNECIQLFTRNYYSQQEINVNVYTELKKIQSDCSETQCFYYNDLEKTKTDVLENKEVLKKYRSDIRNKLYEGVDIEHGKEVLARIDDFLKSQDIFLQKYNRYMFENVSFFNELTLKIMESEIIGLGFCEEIGEKIKDFEILKGDLNYLYDFYRRYYN